MSRPFEEAGASRRPVRATTQARGTHLEKSDEVSGGQERIGDRAARRERQGGDDPLAGFGDEHGAGQLAGAVERGETGEDDVVARARRADDDGGL